MNSDTQSNTPEITGAQAQGGLEELKKKLRRLNWRNGLLTVLLIVVLLFSIYRRYDEGTVYAKPDLDATQQLIPVEAEATPTPAPSGPDHEGDFVLYSVGDAFTAATGSGMVACEVHNDPGSTHDIVMRWTISESELRAHGLSTGGVDGEWIVAQSGLFEPGYSINAMQLRPLPDGSYLPAGLYNLTLYEKYYDHRTGVLASYESHIPITLEVKG